MERGTYTRFEVARILGARSLQISMGAPILVPSVERLLDPLGIAINEFENKMIPITVRRALDDQN